MVEATSCVKNTFYRLYLAQGFSPLQGVGGGSVGTNGFAPFVPLISDNLQLILSVFNNATNRIERLVAIL